MSYQECIYLEQKTLMDTNFRFASKQSAITYASDLSENMSLYPPELTVAGGRLIFDYVPGMIRDVLARIVPGNMMLLISKKGFKGKTNKVSRLIFARTAWEY